MPEPHIQLPGGGTLTLGGDRHPEWSPSGNVPAEVVRRANELSRNYSWTPDHGYPGYRLARQVAQALGGQASLPPIPPLPEGAVS